MGRFRSMRRRVAPAVVAAVCLLGACAPTWRAVETPIPARAYGDVAEAEEIFVLLPGIYDDVDSFEDHGFMSVADRILNGRNDAAFVALDAHYGYYRERIIARRLKDEVLGRFAGKKVTLVGISLGGLGALATARRYPESLDRIVLIAPFLGWQDHIERFKRGAGTAPRYAMEAEIFAVWRWLENGADGIPTTLLYGRDDKFRPAYDYLASTAPKIALRGIDGAHNWPTWNTLWADWLADHVAPTNTITAAAPPLQPALPLVGQAPRY